MDERAIYSALQDVFADVFGRSDIVLDQNTSAKHLADWDSFRHIEILAAVEEQFGVKFRTRDLDEMRDVGDLVRLIRERVNARRSAHDGQ